MLLTKPQTALDQVIHFIQRTFEEQGKREAVIAVSGGIDSALALTLLSKALGPDRVTALLLPYGEQSVSDSVMVTEFNHLPQNRVKTLNILPIVTSLAETLEVTTAEQVRFGNLQARARMICVFDVAKKLDALVCGTENKSEHYLGYFTRFGDAASDIEPLTQWYKTQVRQLAEFLKLPAPILTKAPSAGLWSGQTDESQLGFSYDHADLVLEKLIDEKLPASAIEVPGLTPEAVAKIVAHVSSQHFKLEVPYTL